MGFKTLNQERADFALKEVKGKDKKYASCAKKLPAMITSNGLILTLAFLKSKSDTKGVYDSLDSWLRKRNFSNNDSLENLLNVDFNTLRLATVEALSFANWLKRMSEIELKDEEENR